MASFTKMLGYTIDDKEAMCLATSIMAAGGDTSRMALNTFIMATMSHSRDKLTKYAEFDRYNILAAMCFLRRSYLINALALAKQFDHPNNFLPERWIEGTEDFTIAKAVIEYA
ncbi:hypothetical protein K449DRAFT_432329 [Hypoxylon sp. EC38]|nr:hypothetical protein K449DRAFT_432329 [Hypoxylon sp. EC38]